MISGTPLQLWKSRAEASKKQNCPKIMSTCYGKHSGSGGITNFNQNIRIPPPHPQIQKNWDAAWTFRRFPVGGQKTGNVIGHIPPTPVPPTPHHRTSVSPQGAVRAGIGNALIFQDSSKDAVLEASGGAHQEHIKSIRSTRLRRPSVIP